ncbi:MAG: hypothetical protein HY660_16500, partial [Armatimonadetes bacterium]|nr:hypothetical protein [Armatimonadota bacterium]
MRDSSAPGTHVYSQIMEPLVGMGFDMKVQPRLATAWKQVEPTRLRFTLRKGVKFHDGSPFNAQAVKFHFDRTFDPKAPGIWASFSGP